MYLLMFFPMTGVFYNLALVYSLLCALFILVVEPYRDEYKCHNYLEPCGILSISLILTAIVGVNTSSVQSRTYVKPLLMFTALVASLSVCGGSTISAIYLWSGRVIDFHLENRKYMPVTWKY